MVKRFAYSWTRLLDKNKSGSLLLSFSRQVASAMVYLSTKGYIHRDLAARNILVSSAGICKVSNHDKRQANDKQIRNKCIVECRLVHRAKLLSLYTNLKRIQISDFGLSRDLHDEDYYVAQGGLVPVRWTAPEALEYSKYSAASDVWSFGVVLYEIWSLASKPYGSFGNNRVIQ